VEVVMLRLVSLIALLACALPAMAQRAPVPAAAADAEDEEDEEDDDILAPVRTGDKPATVIPVKERATKVGILPIVPLGDVGKSLGDQLSTELTKAMNESTSVEFVALALQSASGAAAIDPAVAETAKKDAQQLLARSQQLLAKLQFGKAKVSFEKTLALLDKAAPALDTPTLAIEAWLGLGEVAARQAQEDETNRCLAFVVGLNPEYDLDQKRFPGLFVTQHRKVRDRLLAGKKSTIVVDATAAGARVEVDGRPIAQAPTRAKGFYPGQHVVRVLREGLPPWGALVTVEPGDEVAVSPGFFDPTRKGPADDLSQNRFSAASAVTIGTAAAAQGVAGAIVGVLSKSANRVNVQLVYVDAKSKLTAILPGMKLQGDLLDIGIEVLKARIRAEELASAAAPELAEADETEALIEGANAGAGVTMSEPTVRFEVKPSGNLPTREVRGDDDEEGGERNVVESKSGKRRSLEDKGDRLSDKRKTSIDDVAEDAPITEQPWFLPTAITAGVVGVVAVAAGTGVALVAFKVIPDPRPATGAQVSVTLPTAGAQ
jgi:hypothetical protein